MWPVWVLLWKHCLSRKRRYFQTLFDYLSPALFLALIYFVCHDANYENDKKYDRTRYTEPFDLHPSEPRIQILYTPETDFTNQLMELVGVKMKLPRLDHLPRGKEKGYFPLSNLSTSTIFEYSKGMKSTDAIIIFKEDPETPMKLNYTIRMKEYFATDQYEAGNMNIMGSNQDFGFRYEPFMRLQWAIDSSYLQLRSGTNVDQNLTLQEFPYSADQLNMTAVSIVAFVSVLLTISLQLCFIFLVGRLFEEKNSGVHELVKMVGVSWETITLSHVLDLVPIMLIYSVGGAVMLKVSHIIPKTNGFLIFLNLALHFSSVMSTAFATVYVFNITQHIELISMGVYSFFWIAGLAVIKWTSKSKMLQMLTNWLPQVPFMRFWTEVGAQEHFANGVTFSNMWTTNGKDACSVAALLLIMLLQTLLFLLLAGYLSRVRPGNFGQALPWNFPFNKEYWSKAPRVEAEPEEAHFVAQADQQYFEKAPAGLPVGIQINNVYKSFGKDSVLHGINMALYRGEITVLLGHNGAGKTTLISIITGLISATSGQVLVEGKDTFKQASEVRKLIGFCPQQNIFFPRLTVLEHAMFFAMLKGQSYAQAKVSPAALMEKLRLSEKANCPISALSGGMKRRAQLLCGVAGGARVLLLDEPTSGLDVQTRRELWDLLLSLRGDHTVLLTTHFMEEADALGDRIAALHNGVVRCHATTMFLKRAIGTGYRVSFTTIGAPKEAAITSAITRRVAAAALRELRPHAVCYNLPADDTPNFPDLFAALEERRSELGIDTIGVGKSTLDEVFMELCSDKTLVSEETETAVIEPEHEKLTGGPLYWRQFVVLLQRQLLYITSKLVLSLFIVSVVVLLLYLFTSMFNNEVDETTQNKPNTTDIAMNLDLYGDRAVRRAMVDVDGDTLAVLRHGYDTVQFEEVKNIPEAILRTGKMDLQEYNNYLVGLELNDTDAKALYTTTVRHAAPVALNLLSNVLAARLLRGGDARTIATRNHPLKGAYVPYNENKIKQPKLEHAAGFWAAGVTMICLFYVCQFCRLRCLERTSGARHLHVMAGAGLPLYWAAALVVDVVQALLVCVLPVAVLAAALERDGTIDQPGFMAVMCVLLTLGMLAFISLVYLVSTLGSQTAASTALPLMAFICTQLTPNIPYTYPEAVLSYLLLVLIPPQTITSGMRKAVKIASVNAYCKLNWDKCPNLIGSDSMFETSKCCGSPAGAEPWGYWSVNDGPGLEMLILPVQAVVYFILTYLVDSGVFAQMFARMLRARPPAPRYSDAIVRAEAAYVEKAIKLPKKQIPDAILCHNLQKYYPSCRKNNNFFAVKGINFSVKKGECFGLLGVNGAGKTTTFKMLTGDAAPTAGDIFANGHHLSNRNSYMQSFSYCPQFFGLDEFLTGRQNLRLLLTLRGLRESDVRRVADSWLEEVGLTCHADKRLSSYSGGCARRLSACAALCQQSQLALLDEPTAGADPVARRRMHQALLRARKSQSLIIASHSLDEIEALCHRIAIMSDGELCALGSAAALKAQHAAGYSVQFKLATVGDDGVGKLDQFKGELHRRFDCTLQDQHQTMLNYHINDTLRYSELFDTLEQLKALQPGLVEDYTVTETTLEEVFLAFAKKARTNQEV